MRIVFIVHKFGPNFLGGADIHTCEVATGLHRIGHEVSVICTEDFANPSVPANEVKVIDQPYKVLPVRRLHFNWQQLPDPYGYFYNLNPLVEQVIVEYLREVSPDIVHITACDYLSIGAITAVKRLGLPVVLTLTGKWFICPVATLLRSDGTLCAGRQDGLTCLHCLFGKTKTYRVLASLPLSLRNRVIHLTGNWTALFGTSGLNFIHAIERRNRLFPPVLSQVDCVLSPSQCHRQVYDCCETIPAERITYFPYGRDTQLAEPGKHKSSSTSFRFGYTGQIVPHKGVHTLIAAFNEIGASSTARLSVFGDLGQESAYELELRSLAEGNPAVVFRGAFDHDDIGRVLSEIDVLVVPSECVENSPGTIAEAFAAKTPVIGSDTCGVREWIRHDVDGLLFQRGDSDDLARQMQRFLDEPDLLSRLSSEISLIPSIADEVHRLEQVYADLLCM